MAAEIHHQLTEVYGVKAMTEGTALKSVREFKDGCENIRDKRSSQPSVITKGLVAAIEIIIMRTEDSL